MGLLDGVLGGVVGAEMVSVVNGLIEKHGGVQGLVSQFESQGLGGTIKSWIGTGENASITADQVHQAVGPNVMSELAAKAGITQQELATKLAAMLPKAVDALTPGGKVA